MAFGTVAELAKTASTSGASVIRLSTKLGFDGFSSLQDSVQRDLGRQLRPATARIRQPESGDPLGRALQVELDNTQTTLDGVRPGPVRPGRAVPGQPHHAGCTCSAVTRRAASPPRPSRTCPCSGSGVTQVTGTEVQIYRTLAEMRPGDTVVALDLARYDAWLIGAAEAASKRRATVIALTDSALSPLARVADLHFAVRAKGAGPFDSYVGALALLNALVAGVADRLRASATESLDRIEAAWSEAGVLVDE